MGAINKVGGMVGSGLGRSKEALEGTKNWLSEKLRGWDEWVRLHDRRSNYTYGPARRGSLKPEGHYAAIGWISLLLIAFFVLGPNLESYRGAAIPVLLVSLAIAVVINRRLKKPQRLFWYQGGLLLLLSLVIWFGLSDGHTEREGELYRHILFPAFWVIAGGILISRFLAWYFLKAEENRFGAYIKTLELLPWRERKEFYVSWGEYFRSVLTTPFYSPLRVLYFPSVALLAISDRDIMHWVAGGLLLLSLGYYGAANAHERLRHLTQIWDGIFFKGGQLVISLVIVVLALARLCKQQHITTLIEFDANAINLTILFYFLMAYVLFWFYEYWTNRFLLERFVRLFSDKQQQDCPGRVEISQPSEEDTQDVGATAPCRKTALQIHGGARLLLLGEQTNGEKSAHCWRIFSRPKLFEQIFRNCDWTDDATQDAYRKAQVVKQRIRFFFLILNAYLLAATLWIAWNYLDLPQKSEATAVHAQSDKANGALFDLHKSLFLEDRSEEDTPMIFVAASGGGTRAAIYTASVLYGLNDYGLLDQVKLTSSVSGGSAAMAYFSAYQDKLIGGGEEPWATYFDTMAEPFIQDVLEGVVDWRMVGGVEDDYRAGFRLGHLLAESFYYRFGFDQPAQKHRLQIGNAKGPKQDDAPVHRKQFGTIFNTAIVAKFPRWDCETVKQNPDWESCVCETGRPLSIRETECPDLRTTLGKGGRLIFTNLVESEGFPKEGKPVKNDEYLTYEVIQDPQIRLSDAAALSANFPPIFPPSAVDIDGARRYWVTDGGAMDNRGILSLLYALLQAVEKEKERSARLATDDDGNNQMLRRPPLHVFIADASATELLFKRSTGVSAALGAPTRLASQIMVDLARRIKSTYEGMGGDVYFHYLAMPVVFRSDGGLGTHWKLPGTVDLHPPLDLGLGQEGVNSDPIELSGRKALQMVKQLHTKNFNGGDIPHAKRIWQWICRDGLSNHQQKWRAALARLVPKAKMPNHCEPTEATAE